MVKRGSEWHRWDFHVHTPYSVLNNNFCDEMGCDEYKDKNNFEEYVINLFRRALDNDINAIGITDYFWIEGYKKLREEYLLDSKWKENKKIIDSFSKEEIEKIEGLYFFLNIELRTDNFIEVKNKSNSPNVHLLVSDKVDVKEIIDNYISQLKIDEDMPLTIDNIKKIGEKLIEEKGEKGSALYVGMKNITVKFDEVINLAKKYEDKLMVVVPVDEDLSKIEWDGRDYLTRKKYYVKANCYLTSNQGTITNFALNKVVMKDFDGCKPCIWGSDAHDYEKMFRPDENRYCWIKSELSFEGLRQILFEPAERVKIQELNPNSNKKSYNIIDSIEIKGNNKDFQNTPIYFNENLNCIIGGKSTGKSLLLYSVAKNFIDKNGIFYNDDIYNDLQGKYKHFNSDVVVKWKNDSQKKKLIYIPQSYFEKIFYNEKGNNSEIVNRVVENYLCKKFNNIKIFKEEYENKIKENEDKLIDVISEISELEENINVYNELIKDKGDISIHEKEIEEIKKRMSSAQHLDISEENIETYNKLQENMVNLNDSIEKCEKKINFVNKIDSPTVTFKEIENYNMLVDYYTSNDYEDIRRLKDAYQNEINIKWGKDKLKLISTWRDIIAKCREELVKKQKEFDEINSKIKSNSEFENLSKKLENEQKLKNEVEGYISIMNANKIELDKKMNNMKLIYKEYFNIFDNYNRNLKEDETISNNSNALQFVLEKEPIIISGENVNKWVNYRNTDKEMVKEYENGIDLTDNESFVEDLYGGKIVLKSGSNKYDILKECYKRPFTLRYDVKLDNCSLYNSSEGKKAKILLDLIIKLSDEECPILIDQPEDDLDNRSIYEDLVAYIKDVKKNRQMIIVTHNANVVIGADSEEIIIANQDGEKTENEDTKFEYRVGSIEDITIENRESKSILKKVPFRKQVCKILEGGKEAFKLRENKYSI